MVIWLISISRLISKSSIPFNNILGIVPSAPIPICITTTYMFHNLFSVFWQNRSIFAFFYFHSVAHRDGIIIII